MTRRHRVLGAAFIALLVTASAAGLAAQSGDAAGKPVAIVNLNTASAAQLEALPGIGAKVAARIIEYRQKSGGFKKIEDLMNVKGVGEKSFLKLKPLLTVTPSKGEAAQ